MEASDIFDDTKQRETRSNIARALRVATQVFAIAAPLFCAICWTQVQKFEARVTGRDVDLERETYARETVKRRASVEEKRQDAWLDELNALYPDERRLETQELEVGQNEEEIDFNAFSIEPGNELENAQDDKLNTNDALVEAAPFANNELPTTIEDETLRQAPNASDANEAVSTADATTPQTNALTTTEHGGELELAAKLDAETNATNETNATDETGASEFVNPLDAPISEAEVFGDLNPVAKNELEPQNAQSGANENDQTQGETTAQDDPLAQENSNFVIAEPIFDSAVESLPIAPGQSAQFDDSIPAPGAASALIAQQDVATNNKTKDDDVATNEPPTNEAETIANQPLVANNAAPTASVTTNAYVDPTLAPTAPTAPFSTVAQEFAFPTVETSATTIANETTDKIVETTPTDAANELAQTETTASDAAKNQTQEVETTAKATPELEKIALAPEPGAKAPSYFSRAAALFGGANAFSTYYFARTVDLVGSDLLFSPKSISGVCEQINESCDNGESKANNETQTNENEPGGAEVEDAIAQTSYAGRETASGYLTRAANAPSPTQDAVTNMSHAANAQLAAPASLNAAPSLTSEPLASTPNDANATSFPPPLVDASTPLTAPSAHTPAPTLQASQDAQAPTPSANVSQSKESEAEYARRLQDELRAQGVGGVRVERWDANTWRASGVISSGASGGAEFLQGFGGTALEATEQLRARRLANLNEGATRR